MSDGAGFLIFHGNRLENLRRLAVAWLGREPLPPLVPECFLVQGNAMAQWLRLALAAGANEGGCGVAAALEFSLPSTFLWRCYRAVLGAEAVPERSPFDLPLLRWRLAAHRNFKRPLACLWPLESPTDAWVAGRYRPGWLGTDGCDIVLS